jgi:hypothetical protein
MQQGSYRYNHYFLSTVRIEANGVPDLIRSEALKVYVNPDLFERYNLDRIRQEVASYIVRLWGATIRGGCLIWDATKTENSLWDPTTASCGVTLVPCSSIRSVDVQVRVTDSTSIGYSTPTTDYVVRELGETIQVISAEEYRQIQEWEEKNKVIDVEAVDVEEATD